VVRELYCNEIRYLKIIYNKQLLVNRYPIFISSQLKQTIIFLIFIFDTTIQHKYIMPNASLTFISNITLKKLKNIQI